jgi:hypothetical protein
MPNTKWAWTPEALKFFLEACDNHQVHLVRGKKGITKKGLFPTIRTLMVAEFPDNAIPNDARLSEKLCDLMKEGTEFLNQEDGRPDSGRSESVPWTEHSWQFRAKLMAEALRHHDASLADAKEKKAAREVRMTCIVSQRIGNQNDSQEMLDKMGPRGLSQGSQSLTEFPFGASDSQEVDLTAEVLDDGTTRTLTPDASNEEDGAGPKQTGVASPFPVPSAGISKSKRRKPAPQRDSAADMLVDELLSETLAAIKEGSKQKPNQGEVTPRQLRVPKQDFSEDAELSEFYDGLGLTETGLESLEREGLGPTKQLRIMLIGFKSCEEAQNPTETMQKLVGKLPVGDAATLVQALYDERDDAYYRW